MTDVVESEPAVEVLVPLDRAAAEKLDGRIRRLAKQAGDQLVQVGKLLDEARTGRAHEALGYASWTAYVADSVGGQLQLSGDSRQAMVQLMAGEGMSVRAIATATGVSKSTVSRDLDQVSHRGTPDRADPLNPPVPQWDTSDELATASPASPLSTPQQPVREETTTGLDGKEYAKPPRAPKRKGDVSPAPPDPRKVLDRVAPRLEGTADVFDGLDVTGVDSDAVREKADAIRESVARIVTFVDKVCPPDPVGRKQQIPTVLRRNLREAKQLLQEIDRLRRHDDRWGKSAGRFKTEDEIAVGQIGHLAAGIGRALRGESDPVVDPLDGLTAVDAQEPEGGSA